MTFADRVDDAVRHGAEWIASRRWYGDKARTAVAVEPESIVPVDLAAGRAALAIARFSYGHGDDARYFVPLAAMSRSGEDGPAPGLADALRDPAFLAWLVTGFRDSRTLNDDGTWRWRDLGGEGSPLATLDAARGRVLSGEQSNTSVVFGDVAVAKVFRRLQEGLNPDLEIGEFLTRHGDFANAPALYGVIDVEREGEAIAIAAVQQFVANKGDGWEWMLAQLEALGSDSRQATLDAVALLGRRTGELHVALASDAGDDAFAPEPFERRDISLLNERVIAEIQESVEGLARAISPAEVEAIHKGIGRLMSHTDALVGTYRIRVHGDYHLGQTLRTPDDDFVIIDFEGEPSRPIAQRRAKQAALKDVAGMLRSLDYAVATVAARDPEREDVLRAWLAEAERGFVDAYRRAVGAAPVPVAPEDDERFHQGLDLLIAEKALYEVRYELNNRPDWVGIPLNALRALTGPERG
jgi:maltose alpha-D-glucosyltransferase/alpha-amylase